MRDEQRLLHQVLRNLDVARPPHQIAEQPRRDEGVELGERAFVACDVSRHRLVRASLLLRSSRASRQTFMPLSSVDIDPSLR